MIVETNGETQKGLYRCDEKSHNREEGIVYADCWKEKENKSEENSAQQQLIHFILSTVDAVLQYISLLATEQLPQSREGGSEAMNW